ncbi:MAG TPA: hypothetical protein VEU47_17560 [Candidatus Cybelea sp.]|nr:hypothetical protein [Candidatus Cybelea sp.]
MARRKSDSGSHVWRFFRAGGFDQVRIDNGEDVAALGGLDQKLWVALACPTRGIEFDARTLELIDSDKDGRIRAPEILAASAWASGLLKTLDGFSESRDSLTLDNIDDGKPEGKELRASALIIQRMLGRDAAGAITLQDTIEIERILDSATFNGDGIVPPDSVEDNDARAIIVDMMACFGSVPDRAGKQGISHDIAEKFFAAVAAHSTWLAEADASPAVLPLGPNTEAGAALAHDLKAKLDDYFTRCRLAAYDPNSVAALNPPNELYEAMSPHAIALGDAEIKTLPLARIGGENGLPLAQGINPAYAAAIGKFRDIVVSPLRGAIDRLTEQDWEAIQARLAPYDAWMSRCAGTEVKALGSERVRRLADPSAKRRIDDLIARDKALEPEAKAIARVEKLLRYQRDLVPLLNNTVSFRDFYRRSGMAAFQAGTLYLDGRSCELCVEVTDEAKHAQLATLSRIYLAYCRCTRSGGTETMTIAAAFTAGDALNLLVGRNGVFYDRKGRDWDATIMRIIEHPISLRQAFWLPYRQAARFIGDQVQKVAAARAASSQAQMAAASVRNISTASGGSAPAAPPGTPAAAPAPDPSASQQFDAARMAGIFAALGLAVGAIGTAIASTVTGFMNLSWWQMPLAIAGIVLVISGPSVVIAALKLRNRNLGPILDACGWAVNTRLRINIPFGTALTALARLPEHAERSLVDPYAERRRPWGLYITITVVIAALISAYRFGLFDRWIGG